MTGRVFVIGDIHGCLAELEVLIASLGLGPGDTLACLGDYIDRGLESRGVIDLLLEQRSQLGRQTVLLRGNHEDMCLGWLERGGSNGEVWLRNGGDAALRSFGVHPPWPDPGEAAAMIGDRYLAFLGGLAPWFEVDDYLLVHAGIRPGRALHDQELDDLLWIRGQFIEAPHDLGRTVIFGHTPVGEVLVDLPYKIGIDTGCVYGGELTALELPDRVLHQVTHGERAAHRRALPKRTSRRRA